MLQQSLLKQLFLFSLLVVFAAFTSFAYEGRLVHRVAPGETLSHIARQYGTSVEQLITLNALADPHKLHVGQALVISREPMIHIVRPGETLWAISQTYGVTLDALLRFNDLPNPDHVFPGDRLIIPPAGGDDAVSVMAIQGLLQRESLVWPVEGGGIISSLFGPRQDRIHKGLDIAAATGTPILAAADGRVTYADWAGTYGMLVVIDHGNGLLTRYAHASAIHVRVGERVARGQHIANVGSTGRSTGPHLHFEVEQNGEVIDPLIMLPAGVSR